MFRPEKALCHAKVTLHQASEAMSAGTGVPLRLHPCFQQGPHWSLRAAVSQYLRIDEHINWQLSGSQQQRILGPCYRQMGRQVTVWQGISETVKMWPWLELQGDISEGDYMRDLTTWPFMPSKCHRFNKSVHTGFLALPPLCHPPDVLLSLHPTTSCLLRSFFFFFIKNHFLQSHVIYSYEIMHHFYIIQVPTNDAHGFTENINS